MQKDEDALVGNGGATRGRGGGDASLMHYLPNSLLLSGSISMCSGNELISSIDVPLRQLRSLQIVLL